MGKGKTLRSDVRNMVLKVMTYFENEKKNRSYIIPVDQAMKSTAMATGISERTIRNIKQEVKKVASASSEAGASTSTEAIKLSTPRKKKERKPTLQIDDFMICAIRNIINSFYTVKKEIPTLRKILASAKAELNFPGQKTTLWKILKDKLGYKFKKCKKARDFLIQKPEIAAWRARYLRRLRENDELGAEKKPVFYLDETWIHSHYTVAKCWQNSTDASVKKNHNPGQRWIIVHAGGENGFIQNAELLYKCKSKSGDYHNEMDNRNFTKWLNEKLLPNLPPNSIIVLDNAPYHSKQIDRLPNSNSLKEIMQNWLRERNIDFQERLTKPELYCLIKRNAPPKKYEIDELIKSHGHEVLRLPPYQCDLNPIEYIWNIMKQRVAEKNVSQSEKEIEKLTRDAIRSISADDWKREINHVDRLRQQYWESDRLQELNERELIISVGADSESDTDSIFSDSENEMSGVEPMDDSD